MTYSIKTSITLLILAVVTVQVQGFSLHMAAPISSSNQRSSSKKSSLTKLQYARSNDSSSTITMDPSTVTTTKRRQNTNKKQMEDPIMAIAFLNDPSRRYKKRRRPRALSEFDRERKAMAKAALKVQAMAAFEEGQRAAERAILSVLEEHKIQDDCIFP